jgi:hypothetical protein
MSFSWEPLEIELIGDNFAHPSAVPTITVSFLGSMRMLVVGVWEVGMLVPQSYMRVWVRVGFSRRVWWPMLVLVMLVMDMRVRVGEGFVFMLMFVPLR